MAQVPSLSFMSQLVTVQALLDHGNETSTVLSNNLLASVQTGKYTAVAHGLLLQLVHDFPTKLNNDLLTALALPHIRELCLKGCTSISAFGIERLLSKTKRLAGLDLSECHQLMRSSFFRLCAHVNPHLTALTLESCSKINDEAVHTILRLNKSLQHLNVSMCENVTDNVFLLDAEVQFTRETDQKMSWHRPDDYHCSLTSVDVSGCRSMTSTAIRHLTTLCGPTLKHVNISWTMVDCTALWYLSGYGLSTAIQLALAVDQLAKQLQAMKEDLQQPAVAVYTAAVTGPEESAAGGDCADTQSTDNDNHQPSNHSNSASNNCDITNGTVKSIDSCCQETPSGSSGTQRLPNLPTSFCSPSIINQSNHAEFDETHGQTVSENALPENDTSVTSLVEESQSTSKTTKDTTTGAGGSDDERPVEILLQQNMECPEVMCGLVMALGQHEYAKPAMDNEVLDTCQCCAPDALMTDLPAPCEDPVIQQHSLHGLSQTCPDEQGAQFDVEIEDVDLNLDFVDENNISDFVMNIIDKSARDLEQRDELLSSLGASKESDSDDQLKMIPKEVWTENPQIPDLCNHSKYKSPDGQPVSVHDQPDSERETSFTNKVQEGLVPNLQPYISPPFDEHHHSTDNMDQSADRVHSISESTHHIDTNTDKLHGAEVSMKESSVRERTKSDRDNPSVSTDKLKLKQLYTPSLISVDINSIVFHGAELGGACLQALFLTNKHLEKFSMSWKELDDEMLTFMGVHAQHLKHLTLIDCDALSTVGVSTLAMNCKQLEYLNLQGVCFISDTAVLPTIVKGKVRSLILAESNITDLALKKIAKHCCQNLTELDLSWCEEITEEGLNAIAEHCTQLQILALRQGPTSDLTLTMMAENCRNLRDINLASVSCISDSVLVTLASSLKLLEKVDVSWNSVLTDVGVSALTSYGIHLKELILSGIKRLTSKPFLPIISDVSRWRRCQALLRLKLEEQKARRTGEENFSSDEEFEDLYLAHRSTTYLPKLRFLDVEYCDTLNDSHLAEIVAVCRGTITIRDYYGQEMEPTWITCQGGKIFSASS